MKLIFGIQCMTAIFCCFLAVPVYSQSCDGDANRDGEVTVNELVGSVGRALEGCPPPATLRTFYDGSASVLFSGCTDPNSDGPFRLPSVTVGPVQQVDFTLSAEVSASDEEGDPVALQFSGTIDGAGILVGTLEDDDGELQAEFLGQATASALSMSFFGRQPADGCDVTGTLLVAPQN